MPRQRGRCSSSDRSRSFYAWRDERAAPVSALAASERSIAVLPFENVSAEPENAFLADGIQDDVLTSVGKIKELKVIARSSVMDYRGARLAGKVREIGSMSRPGLIAMSRVLRMTTLASLQQRYTASLRTARWRRERCARQRWRGFEPNQSSADR